MTSARDLLQTAAQTIIRRGKVARKNLALNARGQPCKPRHGYIFDAIGALYHVAGTNPDKTDRNASLCKALAALDYAAGLMHKRTIVAVNDDLGFDEVVACYRRAWAETGEPEKGNTA